MAFFKLFPQKITMFDWVLEFPLIASSNNWHAYGFVVNNTSGMVKNSCPLNGECLTPKLVYRADIENNSNNEKKYHLDLSETTFKERYRNHKKESNHPKYQNSTELSKYIWKLKRDKIDFTSKWSIVERVNGNANSTRCNLCLTEKLWIINSINDENSLNKKSELISKRRHLNKVLSKSVKKT